MVTSATAAADGYHAGGRSITSAILTRYARLTTDNIIITAQLLIDVNSEGTSGRLRHNSRRSYVRRLISCFRLIRRRRHKTLSTIRRYHVIAGIRPRLAAG